MQMMTNDQRDLLRRMLDSRLKEDLTDDEFALFLLRCQQLNLDPFRGQIYPVKRWDSATKAFTMALQTSIDGLRLMGKRSGDYAPGKEPSFAYKEDGSLLSATVPGWNRVGERWFEVSAIAYYDEYVQLDRNQKPMLFWRKMAHNQLAKCAESLLIRRCAPQETGRIYTDVEMGQADNEPRQSSKAEGPPEEASGPEEPNDKTHPTVRALAEAWVKMEAIKLEKPDMPYDELVAPIEGKVASELTKAEVQAVGRALRAWQPEPSDEELAAAEDQAVDEELRI